MIHDEYYDKARQRGGRYATGLPERSVPGRLAPHRDALPCGRAPSAALTQSGHQSKIPARLAKHFSIIVLLFFLKTMAIAQESDHRYEVYFFLLDECRICQEMTPYINDIYDQYHDRIKFIGYFPNFSSKPEQIEAFKATYNIAFELKTDYFKKKSLQMGATVLPEAVLYDLHQEEIRYRGRINDLFYAPGKRRRHLSSHDLQSAIESALSGKTDTMQTTPAIGCFINFKEMNDE